MQEINTFLYKKKYRLPQFVYNDEGKISNGEQESGNNGGKKLLA